MTVDEQMMLRAVELAEKGRVTAPPNPWVGCVIVKNGRIIGEGFHYAAGGPHAEIAALDQATDPAGSTVYATLEPCSHFGRTPPCVNSLIKARVTRVVIALQDPDPRVSGTGIKLLRGAGIEVVSGVAAEKAFASLQPYLHQRKTGRAFCVLKAGMSIDGHIAAPDLTSKWITGPEARVDAHQLRAESQAILIGAGTALADDPELTVRDTLFKPVHPPIRVLLDASGKVAPPRKLFDRQVAPALVITTVQSGLKIQRAWEAAGAEVVIAPAAKEGEGVDLEAVLYILGKRGIIQVLVEGGSSILGNFIKQRLADRIILYVGPRILGDDGLPLFKSFHIGTMVDAPVLRLKQTKVLGDSVRLDYSF